MTTAQRLAKITRSARNYIREQGGGFGTKRWASLCGQWTELEGREGFAEAVAEAGHVADVNLGDLVC